MGRLIGPVGTQTLAVATRLGDSPLTARIFVLREGVEELTGSALSHGRAYLRALEAYAAEDDRNR